MATENILARERPHLAVLALVSGAGRIQERVEAALRILQSIDLQPGFHGVLGVPAPRKIADMTDEEAGGMATAIFDLYKRIERAR